MSFYLIQNMKETSLSFKKTHTLRITTKKNHLIVVNYISILLIQFVFVSVCACICVCVCVCYSFTEK